MVFDIFENIISANKFHCPIDVFMRKKLICVKMNKANTMAKYVHVYTKLSNDENIVSILLPTRTQSIIQ
jgi:hypothetical protein